MWAGAIFVASTGWVSGPHTESVVVPLLEWLLPNADPHTLHVYHAGVRKLGHFGEYFVLSLLLWRALAAGRGWRIDHAVAAVVLASAYAVTDELHQWFVPGRTAALGDVGIDAFGALTAQIAIAVRCRRGGR